jgi:PTH1 family peptidyl-tRNA hydrolase
MNISGPSISSVLRKTVKSPRSMIVIQDSLAHKPESLSVKLGGSANGHNGVKGVISALGEQEFYRFRVGIGRGGGADADAGYYVLGKLSPAERRYWGESGAGTDVIVGEIEKVLKQEASW